MIENLKAKLAGEIPVNREELIELINSWGRRMSVYVPGIINVEQTNATEKYDLSKLNVSNIKDFSYLFFHSLFNGDISNWNVSNGITMKEMFFYAVFNGDISRWDIKNVLDFEAAFHYAEFDGDISDWCFNENVYCNIIFSNNRKFKKKYSKKTIPTSTKEFLKWFEENRGNIKELNKK